MPKHQLIADQIALFEEKFDSYEHWQGDTWVTEKLKSFLSTALSEAYEAGRQEGEKNKLSTVD